MSIRYGETITVLRPGGTDRWGQPLPGTEHRIARCAVAPRAAADFGPRTSEATYQRDTVSTGFVLYAPPGADIGAQDVIVRADGSRWHVTGDPMPWSSPLTGSRVGVEVSMERVTG